MADTKTKKTTSRKSSKKSKNDIFGAYMDSVLMHEKYPTNVYKFCKEQNINEANFYDYFGNLTILQKEVWIAFHENTIDLMEKQDMDEASPKEKLLTYFFTLFEILTANRSYCLFALENGMEMPKKLHQLSGLRKHARTFATEIIQQGNDEKQYKLLKHPESIFAEAVWVQFLFLLRFWVNDSSKSFEKTDAAIEKSVQTAFDVFETKALDSLLDFGKFLWKEFNN